MRLALSSEEGIHITKVVMHTFNNTGFRYFNGVDGYQTNVNTCSNYRGNWEISLSTVKTKIHFVYYKILVLL